ncbi:Transcriptional regulatory protein dep1 [Candida albicans]
MSQAQTEVNNIESVENPSFTTPLKRDSISNGDGDLDSTTNQVANTTLGRESPLSDITASPVPFDLSLREADGEIQSTIDNIEKFLEEREPIDENRNNTNTKSKEGSEEADDAVQEVLKEIETEFAKELDHDNKVPKDSNITTGDDVKNRDSYESSELSDLDENQSEAETDKMDFLDEIGTVQDEDGSNGQSNGLSDLQNLSQLTELARLKDVDSDFGDDEDEDELNNSNLHSNGNKSAINGESHKRTLEIDDEHEQTTKKLKAATPVSDLKDKAQEEEQKDTPKVEIVENDKKKNKLDNDQQKIELIVLKDDQENSAEDNGAEAEPEDEGEDNDNGNNTDAPNVEEVANIEAVQQNKEDAVVIENEERDDVDLNKQRNLAIQELIAIEAKFAEVRDKLFKDKLSLLEKELQLCLDGSHPELSKIYGKINEFYQDGLRLANANLMYKLKCVDKETIATRTSIHQNFLRNLMDTKNGMITDTTSLWYKINKERNQLDQLVPDFTFAAIPSIPNGSISIEESIVNGNIDGLAESSVSKKLQKQNTLIELVKQRNNINEQLGILNGLVEFHGFPSAISSSLSEEISDDQSNELLLKKATDEEINSDLRAMGISI